MRILTMWYCYRFKSSSHHLVNGLWWRSVVGLGLSEGCKRWKVRKSDRAFTGHVVELGFPTWDIETIKDIANFFCQYYQLKSMKIRSFDGHLWISIPVDK